MWWTGDYCNELEGDVVDMNGDIIKNIRDFFSSEKRDQYAVYILISSIIYIIVSKYLCIQKWFKSLMHYYAWIMLVAYFLTIICTVVIVVDFIYKKYSSRKVLKERKKYIQELTNKERDFLKEFIIKGDKSTVVYHGNNLRYKYMVEKGILIQRGTHNRRKSPQSIERGYVYDISDWAWQYMKDIPPNN